jgi:DNA polymerase-3 subunit beta
MKSMSVDSFPVIQHEEKKTLFAVNKNEWNNISSLSSFAISTDTSRPVLNTVHVKLQESRIIFESADGFMLSRYTTDITAYDNFDINIPVQAFKLIDNLNDIIFGFYSGNKLYAESKLTSGGSIEIIILLDESGQFPDTDNIVPTDTTIKYYVDTKEIKNIIKRASIFNDVDGLEFIGNGNNLTICANSVSYGNTTDTVDIAEKGLVFEIMFNKTLMGLIMANMKGNKTLISHGSKEGPIAIISSIPEHYCLLAPMTPAFKEERNSKNQEEQDNASY